MHILSSPMDLERWRLFVDAAELGSLSKVASVRGVSQPHVSRRLGELERHCGERLFQRTGRGVVLTAFGQRIAPPVRAWIESTEQLEREIRGAAGQPQGRVRLGTIPSLAHPFLSSLYCRLRQRHPLVSLAVRDGQGAQLEHWLDDGSLDLAILLRSGRPENADALVLAETQTYLVGAPGDARTARRTVSFDALDGLPLVTFCRPSGWRDRLDQLARERGIRLQVVLEADSVALQLGIVEQGAAYALLGAYAVEAAVRARRVRVARLANPAVVRHIALEVARTGVLSPATRVVMREAQAMARELRGGAGLAPSGRAPRRGPGAGALTSPA